MYVSSCSTPSFSSPANSSPANSAIPYQEVVGKPCQGELHIANFMFGAVLVFSSIYVLVFIIPLNMMWETVTL